MTGIRRALGLILVAGVTLSSGPAAMAAAPSTPRQDPYVEITCSTETSSYLAKRVDDRAIQPDKDPGGKDTATAEYNAHNPFGETCVESARIDPQP
jgi:hypothetical protein